MTKPRFSVSGITTFHQSFDEDLALYAAMGVEGIGIWEFKLPERDDAESLAKLKASGLKTTTCIAATPSIFPIPLPGGATDPAERISDICDSIRRLAPFEPEVIAMVTGYPGEEIDPVEARRIIVEGIRAAAKIAAQHDIRLGLEPLHRTVYAGWSTISSIPEAISLMDEIAEPNLMLLYDIFHLWDTEHLLADTVRFGSRIAPSVHICDWRDPTRNDFDRALPGEGIIDLPAIFGALEAGGVSGWFDLEIFSDDGSFTEMDFADSLWKQDPVDVIARAKAGFEAAWEARKSPV